MVEDPSVPNGSISNKAYAIARKDDGSDEFETASPPSYLHRLTWILFWLMLVL